MKLQFIPTNVHHAVDRVVGPTLVVAPTLLRLGRTSPEGLVARAVGGAESVYSNYTDYELNARKLIPMRVHLALDAAGGAALAIVPQLTGARRRGKKHWLPHLAIGALEVGLAVFTKTEPPTTPATRIERLVTTAKRAKNTAAKGVAKVR
jgi:hypothetical protein